ncbi:hypothetical protein OROMI_029336 [Orobanche minor]
MMMMMINSHPPSPIPIGLFLVWCNLCLHSDEYWLTLVPLQVAKWVNLYGTTLRVVEDIRFVLSHSAVPKYLCYHRRDLVRTWMRLLVSVQGMNTLKRETGSHIEDENENIHLPFILCQSISKILSLLVAGAFSVSSDDYTSEETVFSSYNLDCEDQDSRRHSEAGRLSQESSISSITGKRPLGFEAKATDSFPVPSLALWLINECMRSIDSWFVLDETLGPLGALSLRTRNDSGNNFVALKRTFSRFRRARLFRTRSSPDSKPPAISSEAHNKPSHVGLNIGVGSEGSQSKEQAAPGINDERFLGESMSELEGLQMLSLSDWPDIVYDVSSQEISLHMPLHRFFSMTLGRALKECFGCASSACSADRLFLRYGEFLGYILDGCKPYGFSAFMMEHPLQIRVFCAQVNAGMWSRNGDAPILCSEWYRSVHWSEQGQELDLFLLQCCAALAPPDLYVQRILERFGLSNYLSTNLERSSEHEPILVAEMLALLIQIVKERRFCGLTTAECLQRELVYKLSIGDATRSQLVKCLPRDLSKVDELQEILDKVAEYSHPTGMAQGMYKLRSSYWKELDLYHPRWNLRDQQAAEERYLRFCNVSALTIQLPRWAKIYHPLRGIAKIATCKTLLQIVRAVLFYAVFSDKPATSRSPDGVLLTALHLLALALDVCRLHKESGDTLCYVGDVIPILAFANEEICVNKYGEQSMLSLLVLLMRMHEKETAQNFMEAGNFNLSSLISCLIKSFVDLEPGCMNKLQKFAPQLAYQFSRSLVNDNDMDTDLASDSEKHKVKSRERQTAILIQNTQEKMRAQQSKFLESLNSSQDDEMEDAKSEQEACDSEVSYGNQESVQIICSLCHDPKSTIPVSFLVLLQKSRLLRFVNQGPPSWEQVRRSGKENVYSDTTPDSDLSPTSISDGSETLSLSDLVQCALNDFASTGQNHELNAFVEFIKARFSSTVNVQLPSLSKDTMKRTCHSLEKFEENMYLLIRECQSNLICSDSLREDENISTSGSSKERSSSAASLLLCKYIASLPKEPRDNPSASQSGRSSSYRMESESSTLCSVSDDFGLSGADGIYVSSCGHAVHQGCLDCYLSSVRKRSIRIIGFEGEYIVDPDQCEFLCPVCRGLANSVLPALPGDQRKMPHAHAVSNNNFTEASSLSTPKDGGGSFHLQDALSLLHRSANIAGSSESLKALPARNVRLNPNVESIVRILCGMYYPSQDKILETGRICSSLLLWNTLKYSLISIETAARSRKSSLSPNYSLDALYKELGNPSCFVLSLLLAVVQSTRAADPQTFLLRLQGLQLFARSLCRGSYPDKLFSYSEGGHMLHILENAEPGVRYPDIQLWRQASEPILARDAFSSFMWILFCLPSPMLSCKESYLSLVHGLYLVAVIQAIIAFHKGRQSSETELALCDNMITDIHRAMSLCQEAVQYFKTYSIDPAYDIYNAVRGLTFPYLRRCALLWKLINCSNMTPFTDGLESWGGSSPYAANHPEYTNHFADELPEIEKLENIFNIPPLDLIVSDLGSRSTALGWLSHFCGVLEAHKFRPVFRCTPAVPFKLMLLPHLYQDLLQRYIKKCCPDCGVVKKEPALCLLCGKLCSPKWKTCCRESGCQNHAMACGAGIGVFLLIRRTTILIHRFARQAPWPSPYLDAFGEEGSTLCSSQSPSLFDHAGQMLDIVDKDVEMRRGKPLFLNHERYAALTHMCGFSWAWSKFKSALANYSWQLSYLTLGSKMIYSSSLPDSGFTRGSENQWQFMFVSDSASTDFTRELICIALFLLLQPS